jgi:biopolymer transport protein ExbD
MSKFNNQGKPASRDINVTPLIDVVLVLLIIFMVITPIFVYEMAVNMPKKTQVLAQSELPFQPAKAAVCEDGSYAFNGEIMSLEDVEQAVRKNLQDRPSKYKKVVFIDGHPSAPYPLMVQLMDTVKRANAESIGIAKLKTEDGEFDACSSGT